MESGLHSGQSLPARSVGCIIMPATGCVTGLPKAQWREFEGHQASQLCIALACIVRGMAETAQPAMTLHAATLMNG